MLEILYKPHSLTDLSFFLLLFLVEGEGKWIKYKVANVLSFFQASLTLELNRAYWPKKFIEERN